jgi:RES domain-containing protein
VITVWRICTKQHVQNAFSGEGAASNGGRWNSSGTPIVYTAGTQSLAALEILVHTADPNDLIDLGYVVVPVELKDAMVADVTKLPRNWKTYPAPLCTMRLGDAWVRAKTSVALRVPSVVIPSESNFLLNPSHPDFQSLSIGKPSAFTFDQRLASGQKPPRQQRK